ncbi:MAG: hypothetical protein ACXADL_00020 [Candidatus Thorarchaeota archaeon]|jgi:hypothetical protein
MERIIESFYKYSKPRNLGLAIIASGLIVSIMGFLTQILVYGVYGNADMPDTRFGYSYAEIIEAFHILGPDGLIVWLQVHMLDFLFPIAYSSALVFGLAMELRALLQDRTILRYLIFIPIVAAIADYIENILIASQALVYPNLSETIISIASFITTMKWILLYLAFALVLVLILILIYKRLSKE